MSDFKLIIRHLSTGKYWFCKTHSARTQQPAEASQAAKIQLQLQHRSYFKHHLALHSYHQLLLAKESLKLVACQLKLLNSKRSIPETKKGQTTPLPPLPMGVFPQIFLVRKCRCPAFLGSSRQLSMHRYDHTYKPKGCAELKGRRINPHHAGAQAWGHSRCGIKFTSLLAF